jgi:hypothetical protein
MADGRGKRGRKNFFWRKMKKVLKRVSKRLQNQKKFDKITQVKGT